MLEPFATTNDVKDLWRNLKPDELGRAEKLLPIISDSLRMEKRRR